MTVVAEEKTLHLEYEGETVYFCAQGCLEQFKQEHMNAVVAG